MAVRYFTGREVSRVHILAIAIPLGLEFTFCVSYRYADIGQRLEAVREALDLSAADLCKAIGIGHNAWTQYKKGERKVTTSVASRLYKRYGVSYDFIYEADLRSLPHNLAVKIQKRMRQTA